MAMGTGDVDGLAILMNKALAYEPALEPRNFDQMDGSQCAAVALSWKLSATEGALGRAEEQSRRVGLEGPRLFGNLLPDEAPPTLHDSARDPVPPPAKKVKLTIGGVSVGRSSSYVPEEESGFRSGLGGSSIKLPSQLGDYPRRASSLPFLRVNEIMGPSILGALVQEGVNLELAVRSRYWEPNPTGEPHQSQAEALTLARILHLNLLAYSTMREAIESCVWMETALRRLYAILYVENRTDIPRGASWKVAKSILEVYPESSLRVPTLEGFMSREATMRVKELNALKSISKSKDPPNNFKDRPGKRKGGN